MKNFISKKIILGILNIFFILVFVFNFNVKNLNAQWLTSDVSNTVQNTITAGNTTASAFSSFSLELKEYVADGIVTTLLKQIVRQITSSIVNWINSGFEGSPAFIQNPSSFFLDVADQITGDFLAKSNGPLKNLCSPFSIDLRLALSFKYHPRVQQRYTCTLSKIIENSKNAAEGASINGFTAGDFKQGGWPAFVTMTTEPQNNPYGAYLTAESELSLRVAGLQIQHKEELNQGRGFMSWRTCKNDGSEEALYAEQALAKTEKGSEEAFYAEREVKRYQKCEVQTPGSVIAGTLDKQLGVPADALNLADEINEIVDALFAQLVTQVLQSGLTGLSGSGPGDKTAYISQIQNEANAANNTNSQQVTDAKSTMLRNIDRFITDANDFKTNKDSSLNTLIATKNSYESVKACYAGKISNSNGSLSASDIQVARGKMDYIDSKIASDIAPQASTLLTQARLADSKLLEIKSLKTSITSANTINELNGPSQKYSGMIQNRTLTTAQDVLSAKNEYGSVVERTNPMNTEAQRMMQECQIFPATLNIR